MRIGSAAVSALLLCGLHIGGIPAFAASGDAPASRPITAASFAVDLVRASGVPEAGWKSEAGRLLERAGVDRHAGPLTEGVAASLLRGMGLEVVTKSPGRSVSGSRAASFVRQAEGLLLPPAAADPVGLSSAFGPGPASLDDCIAGSRNHGACVNCCKDLGFAANACTRFCVSFTGKPSPSEPLP